MHMLSFLRSLRGRFLAISAVFLLILSSAAAYTWYAVKQASIRSKALVSDYYTLEYRVLQQLMVDIRDVETSLYQYAVLLEDPAKERVISKFQDVLSQIDDLELYAAESNLRDLVVPLQHLKQRLTTAQMQSGQLLQLLDTAESRYPAINTIFNRMYPSNQRVMGAIDLALKEVEEDKGGHQRLALHIVWQRLEHAWMQLTFESRMFIANRSGVFGEPATTMPINHQNHMLWRGQLEQRLAELKAYEQSGTLGIQQSESLASIKQGYADYEQAYRAVYVLLNSEAWRADLPFLSQQVKPAFDAVRETSLVLGKRIGENTQQVVAQSQGLADKLLWFIVALTVISVVLVVFAYLIFVRSIYHPLREVARAMDNAGRGENYSLPRTVGIDEIATLIHAMDGMHEQVQSRQIRLESILENISDGIITIDETGRIETFNKAAQALFGYSRDEAIGQPVTLLMPAQVGEHHQHYLEQYKHVGIRHAIDRERDEVARRKNGTLFPMSIKVKQMELAGQRLFTAVVADISERKAAMERLRELAEKDALTGLHNRRYFLEELERAVIRAQRGGAKITLLYIDLDNFKFVNDTMGHMAGDQVLIEVTEMLSARVRSGDLFARLGGDEFAVLLYELDDARAGQVADSYRQLLADYKFKYEGSIVDIGCSVGIAAFVDGVKNKEELLSRADMACHIAKNAGRNSVHLFNASSQKEVEGMSADMGWARRIKQAIECDGFVLVFQPIVDSSTGSVYSFEALIRMVGASSELIPPAGFLTAAERFGLITEIDRWVIRSAIKRLCHEPLFSSDCHLSINLSAASVEAPSTLDYIHSQLKDTGVDPSRLTFEITETTAITKLSQAVTLLHGLSALGCESALDDFGTGYSSFAYLKELPVDYVKIDGSFVQNLDSDMLNRVMVTAMSEVAHAMGKRTVAEFVETQQVADALKGIGVDLQQGYHHGKPELNPVL
jgi:diguanylate cyclase (GGDEF)-like protein/PAS domain S-box-containing protein